MKTMAFVRHDFTAELWNYTVTYNAGNDPIATYFYQEDVKVGLAADPNSPRMIFNCEKPVRKGAQLRSLKDAQGRSVMPGAWYMVTTIEPILSVYSTLEGYRLKTALANEPVFE